MHKLNAMAKLLMLGMITIAAMSIFSSLLTGKTHWDRFGFVTVDRVNQPGRYWTAICVQLIFLAFLVSALLWVSWKGVA